jgi:hypothetical protein
VLLIVHLDPNKKGKIAEAKIVGLILLTMVDSTINGNYGMGGQGVLPIPVVYNGWVQQLPQVFKDQLTEKQRNPIGEDEHGSH